MTVGKPGLRIPECYAKGQNVYWGQGKNGLASAKADAMADAAKIPGGVVITNYKKTADGKVDTSQVDSYSVWIDGKKEVIDLDAMYAHQKKATWQPGGFDMEAEGAKYYKSHGDALNLRISRWGEEILNPKADSAKVGKAIVDGMSGESQNTFILGGRAEVRKMYNEAEQAYLDACNTGTGFAKASQLLKKAEARMADYEKSTGSMISEEVGKGDKAIEEIKEKSELAVELIACLATGGAAAGAEKAASKVVGKYLAKYGAEKIATFLASKFGEAVAKRVMLMATTAAVTGVNQGFMDGTQAIAEGKGAKEVLKDTGHGVTHGLSHGALTSVMSQGLSKGVGTLLKAVGTDKVLSYLVSKGINKEVAAFVVQNAGKAEKLMHHGEHFLESGKAITKKEVAEVLAALTAGEWGVIAEQQATKPDKKPEAH